MKRFLWAFFTLSILILMFTLTATAATYGNVYYSLSGGEITITGCVGGTQTLKIPAEIDSYPVTKIAEDAFKGRESLEIVVIPDSVVSIGERGFYGCTSLEQITFGSGLTDVGKYAFEGCYVVKKIHIKDIESWLKINFRGASNYNAILFPNHWIRAEYGLYIDGAQITQAVIPDSITSIRDYAFYGCTALEKVTVHDNVTSIGKYSFYNCKRMNTLTLGKRVTNIASSAFYKCSSVTQVHIANILPWLQINFANYYSNPLYFGYGSLYVDGVEQTEISVPSSITSIKDYAFYGCESITKVTVSDNVTSIGKSAFYDCKNLSYVKIGKRVTTIGASAFYNCPLVEQVHIAHLKPWMELQFGDLFANPLYRGVGSLYVDGVLLTQVIVPTAITSINDFAFYGCRAIESVTVSENVTSIGKSAFYGCPDLLSVTLGKRVTNVKDQAFYGCDKLSSVTVPTSVTSIGKETFKGCSEKFTIFGYWGSEAHTYADTYNFPFVALDSPTQITVTPPEKTVYIKGKTLDCSGMSVVAIYADGTTEDVTSAVTVSPTVLDTSGEIEITVTYMDKSDVFGVTVIGYNIIDGTNVWWTLDGGTLTIGGEGEIPDYVRNTNNAPWYQGNTKAITSIVVEDGITRIGNYAFCGLLKAATISVPASVTEVGVQFIRQTAITEITLPGVEIIAGNAFGRADSLTRLVLPECVHDIQGNMFYAETVTVVAPEGSYVDYYLDLYESVFGTGATPTFEADGTATRKILDFEKVGQSAFYTLYENAADNWTLEYSGSGKMTNFAYYSDKNVARRLAFSPARNLYNDGNKCQCIRSAVLGDALTNLGNYALEMCTKVKAVELGDSMIRIGRDAFRSVAIKSLVIPEGVVLIDNQAFANCNALESLTLPSTIPATDPNTMAENKTGLGRDLFLKAKPANTAGNSIQLVVTTANKNAIDYIVGKYPLVAEYSGFAK